METNRYVVEITETIGKGGLLTHVKGPFDTYDDAWQFGTDWKRHKQVTAYQVHKLVPVRSGGVIVNL